MRYVQLRAFHQVAMSGGFSRAASELRLTQPAISDQVRKLEEEYDVLLFSRQHRQIALTAMGERLLAITHRLFDAEDQARELLSESRRLRLGNLRLAADSVHHVLDVLGAFRESYPGVQLTVSTGNTETIVAQLRSYEADIGVLGDLAPHRDFEFIPLNAAPIIAVAAADHPMATRRSLSLAELADSPLVMREAGSRTRRLLEQRAAETGVKLRYAIEVEGREAALDIVASGAGIGFVSAAELGGDRGLARIAIEGAPLLMEEALICLSERRENKAIKAFLDVARGRSAN
ncbi:MAG TPA: LysR substrate-binding domain-containing protein [Bosea sp. (in: a-proteobacteria)]|jgi:aminoethylphosphonate catabolism LysR family transcriptional regulator|uniref:LysR substrate-binding domain-containing protein n=1 Tax=Bosea sp. (in: a-proteobacteria) TaxID=1871050 RepID=UPI002E0DD01B|nr:LysR substrate-binding domain-containing protein [Bosea sp. (in: a-proteobacteria)]